jgi:hypothetical protein
MRGITKEKQSGTIPAHEEYSMFKYALFYNRPRIVGMPAVQYSYDGYNERSLFYAGLEKGNRKKWITFMNHFDGDAYSLFADCYPKFTDDKVLIEFSNTPSTTEFIRSLKEFERAYMQEVAQKCGFLIDTFHPVAYNSKGPKPDITPMNHKNLADLNGMNAVKKWLERKFLDRGLTQIIVYDNLAYHSQNIIIKWNYVPDSRIVPPAESVRNVNVEANIGNFEKRHGQTVSLNNLIPAQYQTQ